VNLFLLGWTRAGGLDAAAADQALGALVDRLPFLDRARIETWAAPSGRAVAAWVTHDPQRVGGVRYVHVEPTRLALFSGRPSVWTGACEADGEIPLDPRFYLEPTRKWAESLDGRWVAARYDDDPPILELCGDALGAYPVYETQVGDARWLSNNAEVLRRLRGSWELEPLVLASMLGGGWSLTGAPIWAGVRRLPRGVVRAFGDREADPAFNLLPLERIALLPAAGFDPERAGILLQACAAALATWPGRPNILQISGGHDSRLILAACLAKGCEFSCVTAGRADSPDVQVGHALAASVGKPHRRVDHDPHGALAETSATARILALMSSCTVSLGDAGGFLLHPHEGPLPLWHSGQGGEIARAHYGLGEGLGRRELVEKLARHFLGPAPAFQVLSAEGQGLILDELRLWVDEQLAAGVAPVDVPDLFYLLKRMANWAGPAHGWLEYGKGDAVAPLWSRRLLAEELGARAPERAGEVFHIRTLEELSPSLARVGFADARVPAERVPTPLVASLAKELHEPLLGQRGDPAWCVVEQSQVEQLLGVVPSGLDAPTREWVWKPAVWRLATVLLGAVVDP
jgi:hypothetical protein